MKRQRQAVISSVLKDGLVKSQNELSEILKMEGFNVSQTTISRDLRELGLAKGRDIKGVAGYGGIESVRSVGDPDGALKRMAPEFLLTAEPTGNMVVVKTQAGNAQGLGAAMDASHIKGIAGTVAGDDTILVVCSEGVDSRKICKILLGYTKGKR